MTFVETSNLSGAALASRHGNTSWTVARELEVRKLWTAGYTASQIALEIGGTTRNAVIGKLHRAGLMTGSRTPGVTIKADPTARLAGSKPGRRPDGFRRMPDKRPSEAAGGSNARMRNTTKIAAKLAGLDPGFNEGALRVVPAAVNPIHSLFDLGPSHCRWPHGDPGKPNFHFCGGEALDGSSYCGVHHFVAHARPA